MIYTRRPNAATVNIRWRSASNQSLNRRFGVDAHLLCRISHHNPPSDIHAPRSNDAMQLNQPAVAVAVPELDRTQSDMRTGVPNLERPEPHAFSIEHPGNCR